MIPMNDLLYVLQCELFFVAVTCFWYGLQGYDHIIWMPQLRREVRCGK